jgi:hypothetical protein
MWNEKFDFIVLLCFLSPFLHGLFALPSISLVSYTCTLGLAAVSEGLPGGAGNTVMIVDESGFICAPGLDLWPPGCLGLSKQSHSPGEGLQESLISASYFRGSSPLQVDSLTSIPYIWSMVYSHPTE